MGMATVTVKLRGEPSVPNLTQIGQKTWEVRAEMHLESSAKHYKLTVLSRNSRFARQLFVNHFCTQFHQKSTVQPLIPPRTDGRTDVRCT